MLTALEIHSRSQCWVANFLEFVGFGLATSIEVVPRSAALLDHLQLCSACLRCALVLDMTLWLSCHHPSPLAKQPRQTQQHLFPVASGSLVFSPESSKRACFGVQLYRPWPSFFLRIRSPSSSGPNRTPQTRNTPCSMLVQVRALPISWVVGPSLAGNRPTARRAPSIGGAGDSLRDAHLG